VSGPDSTVKGGRGDESSGTELMGLRTEGE
jgi:hypothetical protein